MKAFTFSLRRLLVAAFVASAIVFPSSCAFPTSKGAPRQPRQSKPASFKQHQVDKSAKNKRKGYVLRNTRGVRTNRKRPPRWETEGDALFFVAKSDDAHPDIQGETPTEVLTKLVTMQREERAGQDDTVTKDLRQKEEEEASETKRLPPNLSWGPLSTGPILSPKLKHLYDKPTPIQIESFGPITSKKNVVVAAQTGSGKTLAYLLPLLCRTSRSSFGSVMIVTPTTELAVQIQSVVDSLWPPSNIESSSSVHIVQSDKTEQVDLNWFITEMMLDNKSAPIIAGTPAALSKWLELCIKKGQGKKILQNLETVVLDEADRLLQTEMLSRIEHGKRNGVVNPQNRRRLQKKSDTINLLDTITSQGRSLFAGSRQRVQLVCASATVGRTLRRQIMELTDASSVDSASELVCADDRVGKDAGRRKRSLLPTTIRHTFVVQENTDGCEGPALVKSMWEVMNKLPPGPTIIFPGSTGVKVMAETLTTDFGLQCIKTLQDDMQEANDLLTDAITYEGWKDTPIFLIGERFGRGLDIPNVQYVCLAGGAPNSPAAYAHLSGRTGRAGKPGNAVTFVRGMKDAKRVVNIGYKLGVSFYPLFEDSEKPRASDTSEAEGKSAGGSSKQESSSGSKDELESLTVPVLKEMLKERGQKVSGRKGELVERLLEC
jgi:superfamily II DNA/RNA helicase